MARRTPKPRPYSFLTSNGMHAAMRQWAVDNQRHRLKVIVTFVGEQEPFTCVFDRAQEAVKYRTPDGEHWEQLMDGPHFVNSFLPGGNELSETRLKSLFETWVHKGVQVQDITWRREKP